MRFKNILIVGIIIGVLIFLETRNSPSHNQPDSQVEPTATLEPTQKLIGTQTSWFIVHDISKLSLHSNVINKLSAIDFKEQNNCESIINGGFYDENDEHIGLFIEDGKQIQKEHTNSLFNGYISASSRTATISDERPTGPRFALQTGPILIENGETKTLQLMRDEKARRMAAGITNDGNVIFMTFYDASNLTSGPKLVELPQLVEDLNKKNNLNIVDAINLDGGNHSAFISDEVQLTDVQTPGSYFCVKD